MNDTVIQVENLWKEYRLGVISHHTLTRDLQSWWARVRCKEDPNSPVGNTIMQHSDDESFWALQDVSFEVKQGDILGIIGRNGVGKSTLLKILSQVTAPTKGEVRFKGRIASLLEVGTGFHPELTGRENIFLNGAILGMTKADIRKKLDDIVDFAEVEKFIDTPVKRYSSGMYVRLAFAVAAHLEPEILIVDEVLAVGDAQFQKKCLGKMEDVGKEGRTVLFVSHNMGAIEQLCSSCMLLEKGALRQRSTDVRSVIKEYLFTQENEKDTAEWVNTGNQFQNPWFTPLRFALTDNNGRLLSMPASNIKDVWVNIDAEINEIDPSLTVGYAVYSEEGILLYWSYQTDTSEDKWPRLEKGRCTLRSSIPNRFLNEGIYRLELIGGLHCRQWLFEPGGKAPSVYLKIQGDLSDSPYWMWKRPGVLGPVFEWSLLK